MLTPAAKDWVSVIAPIASALAAITALGVSAWVASAQRRIQERQLKQNLFDKRYAVFLAVEEFLMYVLRTDGSLNLLGEELRRFRYAAEQAGFLFDADVNDYMKDINQRAVRDLYPKTFERDQLAKMKQDKPELNIQISQILIQIGGTFLEKRKMVFGRYLQLSRSFTVEGSAAPMNLNGWQRLWVVLAVLWMLPVAVLSYRLWPTPASISKSDVYMRMKPDDTRRLSDYYDVMAQVFGGVNLGNAVARFERDVPRPPPGATLKQGGAFDVVGARAAGYSDDEIVEYLSQTRNFDLQGALKAGSSKMEVVNRLSNQRVVEDIFDRLAREEKQRPIVNIADGHALQFLAGTSQGDINQTTKAYHGELRRILTLKRATLAGGALAWWVVPAAALYALGWAIAWVRRGFGAGRGGGNLSDF